LNGGESRDGASACFDTSFPAVSVATAMPVADREELAWEDRPSCVCPRPTAGIAAGDTVSPVVAGAPAAGIPVAGIPVAGTPAAAAPADARPDGFAAVALPAPSTSRRISSDPTAMT